jgi:hypothetical protein
VDDVVDDCVDEVVDEDDVEVVADDVFVGSSWPDNATAVPAVRASAPTAMAPTINFLVMVGPFLFLSDTTHPASRRPMAALPDG